MFDEHKPTWCPGCGNFGILQALKQALAKLNLAPEKTVAIFDIGCNSNMFNWLPITSFESLHGRPLPVAEGVKIVRPDLTVLAVSGDGGCYGEGGNHFIHAAKHNLDITVLVHDNEVYALTTGQTSPTSVKGFKTKSTPSGIWEAPLNPLALSISANASFVARGFAGDLSHLTGLLTQAIEHKGFSVVDILQPCVTFNNLNTFDWFKERIYKLEDKPTNKIDALKKALEWPAFAEASAGKPANDEIDSKIPIGIFYEEEREGFEGKPKETKVNFESLFADFL